MKIFQILCFKLKMADFPHFCRDKRSKGSGKIVYVSQVLITKRLKNVESKSIDTICIELITSKRKWYALFAYRPPGFNKKSFA